MFVFATKAVLLEVPSSVRLRGAMSVSPMVKGTVMGVSSLVVRLVMDEMEGPSFTGLTVTVKLREEEGLINCPSFTVTTIVATPVALAVGVKVSTATVLGFV